MDWIIFSGVVGFCLGCGFTLWLNAEEYDGDDDL